jgi:hypothetical protein
VVADTDETVVVGIELEVVDAAFSVVDVMSGSVVDETVWSGLQPKTTSVVMSTDVGRAMFLT